MIVKKHISNGRLVLAICDSSLLGKKIENSIQVIDLSSSFYKGEKTNKEDLIKLIKKAYIINAVGENSISSLLEQKVISKREIMEVEGTPYAQIVFE